MSRFPVLASCFVGLLLTALVLGACGDRLRLAHRLDLSVSLPALRAVQEIEARLEPDTLERLGGRLPDIWPLDVPPVAMVVPIDITVLVAQEDLGAIGSDLSRVTSDDSIVRLRRITWALEENELTHPIVDVELWVGPEGSSRPGEEGTTLVGYVDAMDTGQGDLVFSPGGRRAFEDHLEDSQFVTLVRARLSFDASDIPERPRHSAKLEVGFHIDVLR